MQTNLSKLLIQNTIKDRYISFIIKKFRDFPKFPKAHYLHSEPINEPVCIIVSPK